MVNPKADGGTFSDNTARHYISLHLKNIFEEGKLEEKATCKDFLIVQNEGELFMEATIRKYQIVQKEGKGCPDIPQNRC